MQSGAALVHHNACEREVGSLLSGEGAKKLGEFGVLSSESTWCPAAAVDNDMTQHKAALLIIVVTSDTPPRLAREVELTEFLQDVLCSHLHLLSC